MAKAYVCDACGITITNPHDARMKEFYVGCEYVLGAYFPSFDTRKIKVHLCDDCFHALCEIATKVKGGK
jgi:uncharacterized protein YlaI